jgi:predicted metalloprotease with PDZ domain
MSLPIIAAILFMYQETIANEKAERAIRSAPAVRRAAAPDIRYKVSMSKPWTHLLEVEVRIRYSKTPELVELKMPVWTPGSYLVREYARHVQDFGVKDDRDRGMQWQKINKNTWRIESKGAKEIVASYAVYANELTVRTNELNDEHAFWNNAALLMFPKDHLTAPSTVKVEPYGKWQVATGLPAVAGQPNTYRAESFDILYDSPFEVSNFKEINFTAAGKPHRFVVTGEGNYDLKTIAADSAKIAEEGAKIFGELPVDNYLFIVNLRGRGGLEHLNSTALQWDRFGFSPRTQYLGFLNLIAHEYFHLWNVKRIRPDALGPFDYEEENYTKLLWVAEGATAYYEGLLLLRAGLITDKEFLSGRANTIQQLQNRPGRFETSLEESSFDAWIKYYRQDENAVNNQISYYDKGEIVSMLLDIAIRNASEGARSLDDVMRYLYDEFYKKGRNYTPDDYQRAAEKMAGSSLAVFFDRYVRGTAELDYNSLLMGIGLKLDESRVNLGKAYLGADTTDVNGRVTVRSVAADTPAYEQGLNSGDQIVAIDGHRATQSFLQNYLSQKKPSEKVKLTVFRFDKIKEINITLGENTRADYRMMSVEAPNELQKRLYMEYLEAEL